MSPYRETITRAYIPAFRSVGIIRKFICKLGCHDLRWKTYEGYYVNHAEIEHTRSFFTRAYPMYKICDIDAMCIVCKRSFIGDVRSYNSSSLEKFLEPDVWSAARIMMCGLE